MPDLLLEIGCEEIPARMLVAASEELRARVLELCRREKLASNGASAIAFRTPRRLVVAIAGLAGGQADIEEQLTGPPAKVAFQDGKPTSAAEAFARKAGVSVERLERAQTAKGEYLVARVTRKGRAAKEILAESLPKEIAALTWPKSMYWRAGAPERFVRPVRWLVAMLDGEVIPLEYAGLKAAKQTRGHRLFGSGVNLRNAADYQESLRQARVIADPEERKKQIRAQLDSAVSQSKSAGARWRKDDALLGETTDLTEWPSVVLGSFDKEFLALPAEVLVTVMRGHQRYFAVEDASGKLLPYFLAVLNTPGDPEGLIRHGNQRVLRARFNDASFFWKSDQKIPLRERIDLLKNVTFQKELGSYYQKTERVERLTRKLAEDVSDSADVNLEAAAEAAWLAKTDLTTELVKEFTELQGVIGGLYARAQGLDEAVAAAIYDQYQPESVEDAVPRTHEGAVLAIADKADSIAGMFALGRQPTGSKDPFALRRQANGIVKIMAEHRLRIGVLRLMLEAREVYRRQGTKFAVGDAAYEENIRAFFRERLEFYLRESRGLAYDVVNAVLAAGGDRIVDALARAQAISEVRGSEDFQAIAAAFKRIKNILRQAEEKKITVAAEFAPALAREAAEKALGEKLDVRSAAGSDSDYPAILARLSALRPQVDAFFDKVMVMVEDAALRANRLALLARFYRSFSSVADFSEIVTEAKSSPSS